MKFLSLCVILPDWHGPAMSAVEQAQVACLQLGPAYGVFNASAGDRAGRRTIAAYGLLA
jgi:hypothetical protein